MWLLKILYVKQSICKYGGGGGGGGGYLNQWNTANIKLSKIVGIIMETFSL